MTPSEVTELTATIRAGSTRYWTDESSNLWSEYLAPRDYTIAHRAVRRMVEQYDAPTVHRFVLCYDQCQPRERSATDRWENEKERVDPTRIKALLAARVDWEKQLAKVYEYMPTLERLFPNVEWAAFTTADLKRNCLEILNVVERYDATRHCQGCAEPQRCGRTRETFQRGLVPVTATVKRTAGGWLALNVRWQLCSRKLAILGESAHRTTQRPQGQNGPQRVGDE